MAEITQDAYQDLRDYIQNSWQFIELQDDSGTAVLRLDPSDSRVTWTHTAGSQILQLQVVVKGSDTDITAPQTFAQSVIFNVASGGNPLSTETFTAFTIEQDEDQLTVIHNIEVPQV
ncbi:hypothetical protein [Piscibacillus salipiscarius]|uniref:Uncharacterized protein n=1 Tax=Piscibacillus salipiscarius TaxID=299480 RepID=A0ABW5Q982_9BACI|nr:hypothetical protein [Piscibacillus salipiscarius]